jgi:hypothetical protein
MRKGAKMTVGMGRFRFRRWLHWAAGVVLYWGAVLFAYVDLTTAWPTPQRGRFIFEAVIVAATGAYFYIRSKYLLPLTETLELAWLNGGELTIAQVEFELNIVPQMAHATLMAYVKNGQADREQRGDAVVYVFPDIVARGLPLKEAMNAANLRHERREKITAQELANELNISLEKAAATLDHLVKMNRAIKFRLHDVDVYDVPGRPDVLKSA